MSIAEIEIQAMEARADARHRWSLNAFLKCHLNSQVEDSETIREEISLLKATLANKLGISPGDVAFNSETGRVSWRRSVAVALNAQ